MNNLFLLLNSVEINKEREGFDRRALGDWATPGASTMAADVLPLRPALPSVSLVQAINNKKMMLHLHGSADETDGRDGSWDERSVVAALIWIYGGDRTTSPSRYAA